MTSTATSSPTRRATRRERDGRAATGPSGPAGRAPARNRPTSDERERACTRLRRLAAGFTQAFLEVEAGRRTRSQLDPVLCPLLAARLAHVWVRSGPPGTVVRTRGALVAPDRYEAVAIVRRGDRFGAVAIALVRRGSTWLVADAVRPEDGVLAQPPTFLLVNHGHEEEEDGALAPAVAHEEIGC